MKTSLRVNNSAHELSLDPRLTLLDALRDVLGPTGTKKRCDQGACLTLAAACEGQHVVTIEGLATGDEAEIALAGAVAR